MLDVAEEHRRRRHKPTYAEREAEEGQKHRDGEQHRDADRRHEDQCRRHEYAEHDQRRDGLREHDGGRDHLTWETDAPDQVRVGND